MIRKKKFFVRPKKAYEISRIKEENELLKKYALKSKREIWKTDALVNYYRRRAKELAKKDKTEQEVLFSRLRGLGLKTNTTADVLDLKKEDIMERRLPTIVFKKGLAKTPQHARQLVVHKKIFINGKIINIPSYLVNITDEEGIALRKSNKKAVETKLPETTLENSKTVEGVKGETQ